MSMQAAVVHIIVACSFYLRHVSIVNTASHSLSNMFDLQVWRKINDDLASLHSKTLYDPHTISNENAYMDYIWLPGRFLHNSWFNWVLGIIEKQALCIILWELLLGSK